MLQFHHQINLPGCMIKHHLSRQHVLWVMYQKIVPLTSHKGCCNCQFFGQLLSPSDNSQVNYSLCPKHSYHPGNETKWQHYLNQSLILWYLSFHYRQGTFQLANNTVTRLPRFCPAIWPLTSFVVHQKHTPDTRLQQFITCHYLSHYTYKFTSMTKRQGLCFSFLKLNGRNKFAKAL